jgi:2-dehydropantoate 2-reductase
VEQYVRDFGAKIPNSRPSMLLDHMAGRRSEIDFINGAIPPIADALGLHAPYNEVISSLVRAKERRLGFKWGPPLKRSFLNQSANCRCAYDVHL